MGKRISTFIITFVVWIAVFILQKPLFMLAYNGKLPSDCGIMQYIEVIYHGLPLDISLAGYLTCLPALLLIASVWIRENIVKAIMNVYIVIAALIVAVSFCINIGLYEYWGFPLDATPVFYFLSSPKDAMASMTIPMAIGGIVGIGAITALISWILIKVIVKAPLADLAIIIQEATALLLPLYYSYYQACCLSLSVEVLRFLPLTPAKHISQRKLY